MATTLWGKVYLHGYAGVAEGEPASTRPPVSSIYVGRLQEDPGGRCVFSYDESYRNNGVAIAHTLPLRTEPHVSEGGLHPFFDNLVAEGWLRDAQARALGVDPKNRLALLLGFGHDLAGAVSVEDPEPQERRRLDHADKASIAALLGKASLSGIQRKLLVVPDGKSYRPVRDNELSTHIAKLASGNLGSLLELEYLTTQMVQALLPNDTVAQMEIVDLPAVKESALIIERFDRTPTGKRLHFEEFNQLLGKHSGDDKYDGTYENMGEFVLRTARLPVEAYRLMCRIFACLLVGNTDAHFKNFALFHTRDGLRLTPAYDLVASSFYRQFQVIALGVAGKRDLQIGALQRNDLLRMGTSFGVNADAIESAIDQLGERLSEAFAALDTSPVGSRELRNTLQKRTEKRWKGSFVSTGRLSSKKRSKGERTKS